MHGTPQSPPHTCATGDPYYRFNDINYQWIPNANWTYNRTFAVPAALLALDEARPCSMMSYPRDAPAGPAGGTGPGHGGAGHH